MVLVEADYPGFPSSKSKLLMIPGQLLQCVGDPCIREDPLCQSLCSQLVYLLVKDPSLKATCNLQYDFIVLIVLDLETLFLEHISDFQGSFMT